MDNNVVPLPRTPSTGKQSVTGRNEPTPLALAIHHQGTWHHYRGEVRELGGELQLWFLPGNLPEDTPYVFYGHVTDLREAVGQMTDMVWAQFDA